MQDEYLLFSLSIVFLAMVIVVLLRFVEKVSDKKMLISLVLLMIPGIIAVLVFTD